MHIEVLYPTPEVIPVFSAMVLPVGLYHSQPSLCLAVRPTQLIRYSEQELLEINFLQHLLKWLLYFNSRYWALCQQKKIILLLNTAQKIAPVSFVLSLVLHRANVVLLVGKNSGQLLSRMYSIKKLIILHYFHYVKNHTE